MKFDELFQKEGRTGRFFPHLDFGGKFTLSIQAGEYWYSTPRKFLDDATQYTDWEMAFFTEDGLKNPLHLKDLPEGVKEVLRGVFTENDTVAAYAEKYKVQEIFDLMRESFGDPRVVKPHL